MANNAMTNPEDSKQMESMQQAPSAPPMGPPPSYSEAMNSSPYPPMPVPATSQSAPYPTTDSSMPVPQPVTTTAPYPVDDNTIPQSMTRVIQSSAPRAPYPIDDTIPKPMTQVQPPHAPLRDTHLYTPPMGFNDNAPPSPHAEHHGSHQQQPIVNQPSAYNNEYVHPKTTYVVLQDDSNRRRNNDDDCSCLDWLMCCWCSVETCRCLLTCCELIAACSK